MNKLLIFFSFLIVNIARGDIGSVPGTLNQVERDPAQREFEQEYQELGEVLEDLDSPEEQRERPTKTKPTHHQQDEPGESRALDLPTY